MARYIEAETLIEFVKKYSPNINGETTLECVERAIRNVPTEDVVPRSEVEYRLERLNAINEDKIKVEVFLAKQEVEDLKCQLEREREYIEFLKVNIVSGKQEVSKQIFEEIEKNIEKHYNRHIFGVEELSDVEQEAVMNFSDDVSSDLDELRKKYIGE